MSNESRLLGKQIIPADGFSSRADMTGPAVFAEGANIVTLGPLKINDSNALTIWSTVASIDFASIAATGSGTSAIAVDAVMSGVAVGDWVNVVPIGSYPDRLFMQGACFSAGAVHIKGLQNGSGAFDPAALDVRIIAIKVS